MRRKPTGFEVPLLTKLMKDSLECRDLPLNEEPYKTALETAQFLDGMPRYPKMHPCGVVLSRQPLRELTATLHRDKTRAAPFARAFTTDSLLAATKAVLLRTSLDA